MKTINSVAGKAIIMFSLRKLRNVSYKGKEIGPNKARDR